MMEEGDGGSRLDCGERGEGDGDERGAAAVQRGRGPSQELRLRAEELRHPPGGARPGGGGAAPGEGDPVGGEVPSPARLSVDRGPVEGRPGATALRRARARITGTR